MIELTNSAPVTPRKRTTKILAGTAVLVVGGGAAFAYWAVGGSGTGTATSGGTQNVTVVQTAPATGLAPGSGAHALSGTFTNPNGGPVYVGTLTASISSVVKADGAPEGSCTASDYTLTDASEVLNKEVPADDTGTWSGISISFVNTNANQDGCKGATVNLSYTLS